jgi:ATP-dependent DNA helicase RecG
VPQTGWHYPGPDPSIRIEALSGDKIVARCYRNRRIGEFLKELDLTEGRCTGIPIIRAAMARNGSPPPKFSTDEGRTHFLVELPVHPEMRGSQAQAGTKLALSRHQVEILEKCRKDTGLTDLMAITGRTDRTKFRQQILNPLLDAGLIEMTIPGKPRSSNQEYRLAPARRVVLDTRSNES